jgi:hypothetical protein
MKYLNIALVVAIVFFISTTIYYSNKITEINSDFSKNYWLHPNNPSLAGSYIEYIYTGKIVDSSYEGDKLVIKISNTRGEKELMLESTVKDKYLTELSTAKSDVVTVVATRHSNGTEQVNNISFAQNNVQ